MGKTQIRKAQAVNEDFLSPQEYALVKENSIQAEIDFGFPDGLEGDIATVTIAAAWVTENSIIICVPCAFPTSDHSSEDVAVEGIVAYPSNIIAGISFDIIASAPRGTWGKYKINCIGTV